MIKYYDVRVENPPRVLRMYLEETKKNGNRILTDGLHEVEVNRSDFSVHEMLGNIRPVKKYSVGT